MSFWVEGLNGKNKSYISSNDLRKRYLDYHIKDNKSIRDTFLNYLAQYGETRVDLKEVFPTVASEYLKLIEKYLKLELEIDSFDNLSSSYIMSHIELSSLDINRVLELLSEYFTTHMKEDIRSLVCMIKDYKFVGKRPFNEYNHRIKHLKKELEENNYFCYITEYGLDVRLFPREEIEDELNYYCDAIPDSNVGEENDYVI